MFLVIGKKIFSVILIYGICGAEAENLGKAPFLISRRNAFLFTYRNQAGTRRRPFPRALWM